MGIATEQLTTVDVALRVNGSAVQLTLDPRTTLLDALREHLRLTGSKRGAITVSVVRVPCTSMADASSPA